MTFNFVETTSRNLTPIHEFVMIEETARVTRIQGDLVDVESVVKSGCSSCQQVDTCGSGQIAKGMSTRYLKLTIQSSLPLNVGDEVVIALPENKLLSAAMQVYILPLIGLLIGGAIGQYLLVDKWQLHELFALLLAAVASLSGFLFARYSQNRPDTQKALQVKILRKCDNSHAANAIGVNIHNK
ncbi:SoxR reducing system RseC family protein [Thalassotalea sp. PS06]|uniref:SoxR reducing system RseC family protein n=1 Tax=Thalassotalea sp. PS06 TaxID=2594005 RepID=UPI00163D567F|nr:SoxR reducing system RseC family protein [Thalassotalea sp. PS06]